MSDLDFALTAFVASYLAMIVVVSVLMLVFGVRFFNKQIPIREPWVEEKEYLDSLRKYLNSESK